LFSEPRSDSNAASSIAGASGGTGILGLATLIPENYAFLKQALIYISPTASIIIGIVWSWGAGLLVSWLDQLQFERSLKRVRKLRDDIVANPNSSPEHCARAQENVEIFEQLAFGLIKGNTQSLHASLASVGSQNPSDPPKKPRKGASK
jgi:hypothetical protein